MGFFRSFLTGIVVIVSSLVCDAAFPKVDYAAQVRHTNRQTVTFLNARDRGASYHMNKFAHIAPPTFSKMHGLSLQDDPGCNSYAPYPNITLPKSWDWREHGAVTSVKDQGQCGSCWSFSAAGDIEGTWFLSNHSLVSLSEQEFVDCDTSDHGCNGGWMTNAFQFAIDQGVETDEEYPYRSGNVEPGTFFPFWLNRRCEYNSSLATVHIQNYTCVGDSDNDGIANEHDLAKYLVANGPLAIAINAGPMQFYESGIADPPNCDPTQLDHGVLLVGFGEGDDNSGRTVPYWIIKNSWGEDWGENGYYRIIRGRGACGLNTAVSHSIFEEGNY